MVSMQLDMVLYAITHDPSVTMPPYVIRHGLYVSRHGSYATKYIFYVSGHSFDQLGYYASRNAFVTGIHGFYAKRDAFVVFTHDFYAYDFNALIHESYASRHGFIQLDTVSLLVLKVTYELLPHVT